MTLPSLQPAVDALYARISAGQKGSTGKAVATGMTGRIPSLSPEDLAILTDVMSGKKSARMTEIWSREDLYAAGASEDDGRLECEISYQIISRGTMLGELIALDDDTRQSRLDATATTVERIMRAGPYRSKWDGRRGAVTWLAQDCANAVQTTYDRLKAYREKYPDFRLEDDQTDETSADETLEQRVARQDHELAALRSINAVQRVVLNAERAEKEAAVETVRRIGDVLAIPSKQLIPAAKLVTIATILETHSRASRGQAKLPIDALVDRTGLSKNAVATHIQDLAARDGSPIARRVTRDWVTDDDGMQHPISVSLVTPQHDTVNESFAAVLTMGGPSAKAQQQRQAALDRADRAAQARQWGRCSSHDNDLVAIKGYCPDCGEVVGERVIRVAEFEILNPIVCVSDPVPPPRG